MEAERAEREVAEEAEEWSKPWQPRHAIYLQTSLDRLGWVRWVLLVGLPLLGIAIWLQLVLLVVVLLAGLLVVLGVAAAIWVYDVRRLNRYAAKPAWVRFYGEGGRCARLEYYELTWWGLYLERHVIELGSPEWEDYLATKQGFTLTLPKHTDDNWEHITTARIYLKLHTVERNGRVYQYRYWHAHRTGARLTRRQFHKYIGREDALTAERLLAISWECFRTMSDWEGEMSQQISRKLKNRRRKINWGTKLGHAIRRYGTDKQKRSLR